MYELIKKKKKIVDVAIRNLIISEQLYINYAHDDFLLIKDLCLGGREATAEDKLIISQTLRLDTYLFEGIRQQTQLSETEPKKILNLGYQDDFTDNTYSIVPLNELRSDDSSLASQDTLDTMSVQSPSIVLRKAPEILRPISTCNSIHDIQLLICKRVIVAYFAIVKKQLKDIIPKQVFCHLVNGIEYDMNTFLIDKMQDYPNKLYLLEEDPEEKALRERLTKEVKAFNNALDALGAGKLAEGPEQFDENYPE